MRDSSFFDQIEHVEIPWGERTISAPGFYYDVTTLAVQFSASLERVKAILPSPRMHPVRITPWHCVVGIAAFEYRDCDIGPYNEISIGIPILLDKPSPAFTGTLQRPPAEPWVYVRHLPVNTEIARDAGIEFAGFPKTIADIEFEQDSDWIKCHMRENGRQVLTLAGRKLELRDSPRYRMHAINLREGRMLRCETIFSEALRGESRNPGDVKLELGEHPIADELKGFSLGRLLSYQYAPQHLAILTPAIESLAA